MPSRTRTSFEDLKTPPEAAGTRRWQWKAQSYFFLTCKQVFRPWKDAAAAKTLCKVRFFGTSQGNLRAVWDGRCPKTKAPVRAVWSSAGGRRRAQTQTQDLPRPPAATRAHRKRAAQGRAQLLLPSAWPKRRAATLCPAICQHINPPDGNLLPKHDAFHVTKPEHPSTAPRQEAVPPHAPLEIFRLPRFHLRPQSRIRPSQHRTRPMGRQKSASGCSR